PNLLAEHTLCPRVSRQTPIAAGRGTAFAPIGKDLRTQTKGKGKGLYRSALGPRVTRKRSYVAAVVSWGSCVSAHSPLFLLRPSGKGAASMKIPSSVLRLAFAGCLAVVVGSAAWPNVSRADTDFSLIINTPNNSGSFTASNYAPPYGTV